MLFETINQIYKSFKLIRMTFNMKDKTNKL